MCLFCRHACRGSLFLLSEFASQSDNEQDNDEEESSIKEENEFMVKEEQEEEESNYDDSPYPILPNDQSSMSFDVKPEENAGDFPYLAMPSTSSVPPPAKKLKNTREYTPAAQSNTPQNRLTNLLDLTLAKFFIGCNIPFSVVESQYFKNMLQALRPSYTPPALHELSSVLLETVTDELKEMDKIKFKAEVDCVLLIEPDDQSMHTVLRSSDKVTYLESFEVTTDSDTEKTIREIVQTSVKTVQRRFGDAKFFAVVSPHLSADRTDNQRVMYITCSRYAASCLMRDVLDKDMAAKVDLIRTEFQRPRLLKQILKLGGKHLLPPSDTQLTSYYASYKNILSNLYILRLIATTVTSSPVSSSVANLLLSQQFISNMEDAVKLYEPICTIIEASQESSLADITELWLTLSLPDKKWTETVDRHCATVLNKFALTANFLHHTYRGKNFSVDHVDTVEEYLISVLDDNGLNDLMAYKKSDGLMGTLFGKNLSSPITFWTLAARKHESLADLALKLMKIPASSMLFNRPAVRWAAVHNRNKDRLSCENLENLIYSYCLLRTNDIETDDF
jgi:hypothetical protein